VKVLVVGSGGREHALCWALSRSPKVSALYCAPGNPGTAGLGQNLPIASDDLQGLCDFAEAEAVDLTVVGPEAPLCAGIADRFAERGLLVAGPSAAAAQLEGSKVFAKRFMARHAIPTAAFEVVENAEEAAAYLTRNPQALVVKAAGLAAGKGVVVAGTVEEALAAATALLERYGGPLVLEERLEGEEVSVIALCDGERVLLLASSQDHKAAFDGDTGPNTGGMGAYSPAPVLDEALTARVKQEVLLPTVRGMAADGNVFRGVLYAGLMIVKGEPIVLEYNCRFGDPEAQVLLMRLKDDLAELLEAAAKGQLLRESTCWDARPAVCVVMAAEGYPGSYEQGASLSTLQAFEERSQPDDAVVFHSGTCLQEGQLVTKGGRVLGVTALGDDIQSARRRVYELVEPLRWTGAHYRTDIGWRAVEREQ